MAGNATTVVGIDGCPGGWLAATVRGRTVRWRFAPRVADLLVLTAAAVGIDMPMGLSDGPPRACDLAARGRLGRRWMCVFHAPVRAALSAPDRPAAHRIAVAAGGPGVSAQADGIRPRVAELDAAIAPEDQRRVVEVHPELSFAELTGAPLPAKNTPAGRRARRAALAGWVEDLPNVLAAAPAPARGPDALDALAAAWSARRWATGAALVLPHRSPPRDRRGLRMQIVV